MFGNEVSTPSSRALIYADKEPPSLAYCELYIGLTALVLRVLPHLELYKTTPADVEFHHDVFVAGVRPESEGVRVIIK